MPIFQIDRVMEDVIQSHLHLIFTASILITEFNAVYKMPSAIKRLASLLLMIIWQEGENEEK